MKLLVYCILWIHTMTAHSWLVSSSSIKECCTSILDIMCSGFIFATAIYIFISQFKGVSRQSKTEM